MDIPLAENPQVDNDGNIPIIYKERNSKKEPVKAEAEKATPALPHGKHENVFLTDNEYRTLVETYGKEQTDYSIDTLSDFKKKKPNFRSIKDFNKLMTSWIKQDIGWGKTPQLHKHENANTTPANINSETLKTSNEFYELLRANGYVS